MPKRHKPVIPPTPHLEREQVFWQQGLSAVAGVDEAGRGAWAGPVVAAAVMLPAKPNLSQLLPGVNDSKKLGAPERTAAAHLVQTVATAWAIGAASATEIDQLGILPATRLAMQRAINALQSTPQALLIDAVPLPETSLPQQAFYFADAISLSVAAASILAKVHRDQLLCDLATRYPQYGFAQHKGYGTAQHRAALDKYGASPAHRLSYRPLHAAFATQLALAELT